MYTIYQTTNLINNKIYIGVHKTNNQMDNYLGSGLHLKRAIKKYGPQNFQKEILKIFQIEQEAYSYEKEIVNKEFIVRSDTYNMKEGGHGGWITKSGKDNGMYGKTHTDQSKLLITKASMGNKNCIGRKLSIETKKKMSHAKIGLIGTKHTTNHKKKMSKLHQGKGNPMYGKSGILSPVSKPFTMVTQNGIMKHFNVAKECLDFYKITISVLNNIKLKSKQDPKWFSNKHQMRVN